jgi:hypothetical protein
MVAFLLPVYQMLPARSVRAVCGIALAGSGYSFMLPVAGSMRPRTLPHCPTHQMLPSAAWTGSRERWPSVGTCHSLKEILAAPGTSLAARLISSRAGLPDRSIMVPMISRQPAAV